MRKIEMYILNPSHLSRKILRRWLGERISALGYRLATEQQNKDRVEEEDRACSPALNSPHPARLRNEKTKRRAIAIGVHAFPSAQHSATSADPWDRCIATNGRLQKIPPALECRNNHHLQS